MEKERKKYKGSERKGSRDIVRPRPRQREREKERKIRRIFFSFRFFISSLVLLQCWAYNEKRKKGKKNNKTCFQSLLVSANSNLLISVVLFKLTVHHSRLSDSTPSFVSHLPLTLTPPPLLLQSCQKMLCFVLWISDSLMSLLGSILLRSEVFANIRSIRCLSY